MRKPLLIRTAMAKLVLVKHSAPEIVADVPPPRWALSERGRERCAWLAHELACHRVTRLFTSLEPKALETAALVAGRNGLVVEPHADLHENDRTGMGFLPEAELLERVRRFFKEPQALVMGNETADAAFARFGSAVAKIEVSAPDEDIAVIAHGTVLTLFVARHNDWIAPFDLWSALKTPSYVVLVTGSYAFDACVRTFDGPDLKWAR